MTHDMVPPDVILDHFVDQLDQDPTTPAPAGLELSTADLVRRLVADAHTPDVRASAAQTRVWHRLMAASSAGPENPMRERSIPLFARLVPRRFPRGHLGWLAAAAALVILALVGTALGTSPNVQAQARRLVCLVSGLGLRLCETGALTSSTPQVTDSRDGLTLTVLQVLSDGGRTTVELRLSGLALPDAPDANQDQHVRDALPILQAIKDAQLELTDDQGRAIAPQASSDQAQLSGFGVTPVPPRMTATAAWSFAALDPNVHAVELVYHGPEAVGTWTLHVPLISTQAAQLAAAGDAGSAVTERGVTLQVTGVAQDVAGQYIVEVSAHTNIAGEQVGAVGTTVLDQNTWGLVAWDSDGHQYAVSRANQFPIRYEGDTVIEDLVVPGVPASVHVTALEVSSVFVSRATHPLSFSVSLAGHQIGEDIPLDETLHLSIFTVRVTGASLTAPESLRVDLDLGGLYDGRELVAIQTFQIDGVPVPPFSVRAVSTDRTGHQRSLGFAIAQGEQNVTVTLQGAAIGVAGPWRLPLPNEPSPAES